jgi:hypothetical protein
MKKFILISILILAAAGMIFAQESPTSTTTGGLFTTAADNFMVVNQYDSVEFEKNLALVSFAQNSKANLGFATKTGSLYIGAFYSGNFWSGLVPFDYTEQYTTWPGGDKTVRNYDFTAGDPRAQIKTKVDSGGIDNNFGVLLGVADMGFKLSFSAQHQGFKDENFAAITTGPDMYLKSGEADYGFLTPGLAWGFAKDLTENGIRPYVTLDLKLVRDYLKYVDADTGNTTILASGNYANLALGLGLGGFTFYKKEAFELSFDVDYVLDFDIPGQNEYSYPDGGGTKVKTFNGLYGGGNDYSEASYIGNDLTPALYGIWSDEKFSFAFGVGLNLNFHTDTTGAMVLNASNSLVKEGASVEEVYFGFEPTFNLAAQWQIHPKFALNIGGEIKLNAVSTTTTTTEGYANGSKLSNAKTVAVVSGVGGTDNKLSLGTIFDMTKNLTVEASCGISNAINAISVFDTTNGLFIFGNILFTAKF